MKKTVLFLISISTFILTHTLSAQWVSHGPYGGAMTSLTSDNSHLYVGTMANGVFKSSDNGITWQAANNGLESTWITDLATNPAGVFAGTNYKGIFFSSDQGVTWTQRNNGLIDLNIVSLFYDGNDMWASNGETVYYSNNNGLTWQERNNGIPYSYAVYSWAAMGDTLYAGTYASGMYMSNNDGQSWTQVANGFPVPSPTGAFVYDMTSSGNTIYAATNLGIYVSNNRGISWAHSGNSFMSNSGNLASALAVINGTLWAGTHSQGIYYSTDQAVSFVQANNGIQSYPGFPPYQKVTDLTGTSNYVLASTHFGLYRTTDNGLNWKDSNEGILATDVSAVVSNGHATFAGTHWTGMYVTTNDGASWMRANNGLTGNHIKAMTTQKEIAFASVQNKRVWKSNNNGIAWTWAGQGLPADAEILEADTDRVLAVTAASKYVPNKLYQTKDQGLNWTDVPTTAMGAGFTAIAVRHPYIYLGTGNGLLFRSSNEGQGWADISLYMPNVKITTILPLDTVTYVGTDGKGIWMYLGNHSYMLPAMIGLTNYFITDIIKQDGVLFASTNGGGVFVSSNGGVTWSPLNGGLMNQYVKQMAGDTMKVFAGTGAGVYQTDQNAFKTISILASTRDYDRHQAISFYPNPSSGKINIASRNSDPVSILVFDLKGSRILDQRFESGSGTIDLSPHEKGLYIVRIAGGDYVENAKLLIE